MIEIIVVEDEALIARRLTRMLAVALQAQAHRVRCFETLDDAQECLSERSIDLLLLDLNLHGQDGFKLLKHHVHAGYDTIVVSANTERAIEAFEIGVVDFVAKPFNQARIDKALARFLAQRRAGRGAACLGIEKKGQLEMVPLTEIAFIRAAGHYSDIILRDGVEHLHSKSLSQLLSVLPEHFQQVHRSYLVDMTTVTQLIKRAGSQYELVLDSGHRVPLGRSFYPGVKARFS